VTDPSERARHAALLPLIALLLACHHAAPSPATDAAASPPPPAPTASGADLPPLGGDWFVHLPLEGFGAAGVSVPLGTTTPRPLVVALHARADRPEWACGEWRGITQAQPFILCPHGVPADAPSNAGLVFAGIEPTRREIDAGIAALRARFGPYVAEGPMICAGFSLGANLGVRVAAAEPARFPIAVLGEGGHDAWTPERVAGFAKGGGKRVLFVCSTGVCDTEAARPLLALAHAGVETKLVSAGHIGHLVDDRVVSVVREAWPWVTGEGAVRLLHPSEQ
jgi:hypothetical protein